LVRFDGLRFEPFRSPFGDQLLSTGVYALFAPPSGGLWSFAQDGDGIVWATTTSGLWRFDHSRWRHIGAEWDVPQGNVQHLGFDSEGTLWALSGRTFAPMDLVFLMPGTRQFTVAAQNLFVYGFTLNADGAVVTEPEPNSLMADSRDHSDGHPSVYPVLRKDSFQIVDRNNGVWILPQRHAVMRV
jgi:streptogramin lyase